MKRSWIPAFGMITMLLGVLVWFAREQHGDPQAPADMLAASSAAEIEEPASTNPSGSQTQTQTPVPSKPDRDPTASPGKSAVSELPDFNTPPDQAIARLRELADAGNRDAQIQLSRRLGQCTTRALRATAKRDDSDRQSIESDRTNGEMDADLLATRIGTAQKRLDQHAAERAACEALPAEVLEHWLDPIDQAAQSGNINAMRQYAARVVEEYDSLSAVVTDVDQAIVRRDKARAYLNRAVSLGEAEALADLAYAYFDMRENRPQLYAVDNYQAYMYAYAAALDERTQYRQLNWIMDQSAESLDSSQISDARKQGKRLYDTCCLKR